MSLVREFYPNFEFDTYSYSIKGPIYIRWAVNTRTGERHLDWYTADSALLKDWIKECPS